MVLGSKGSWWLETPPPLKNYAPVVKLDLANFPQRFGVNILKNIFELETTYSKIAGARNIPFLVFIRSIHLSLNQRGPPVSRYAAMLVDPT